MKIVVALIAVPALVGACGPMAPEDDDVTMRREEANTVCAEGPTVPGIDVSHWQGNVDWAKVKGAGYEFGVAKATEGTDFVDPEFKANWSGMKDAGMIRGAYHFLSASEDPIAQAKHFTDTVGKIGDGDLPLVLDLESNDGVSDATVITRAKKFLAEIEAISGRTPMLYSGYFFKSLGSPDGFSKYPLWIPQYGPTCPDIPEAGWKTWMVFQYTSEKNVPGVSGGCDADKFNGSLAELKALASLPNVAPVGKLESASCTGVKGWAQDPDTPAKVSAVKIFADGGPKAGKLVLELEADDDRDDLCEELGSCKHGFEAELPATLSDGEKHALRAYAVDSESGVLKMLEGSPASITCTPTSDEAPGAGGEGASGSEHEAVPEAPVAEDVADGGGCTVSAPHRRLDALVLLFAATALGSVLRRRARSGFAVRRRGEWRRSRRPPTSRMVALRSIGR